jgi:hypothetical protein
MHTPKHTPKWKIIIGLITSLTLLSSCTPSSTDISLYTTDVEVALEGEVIEVPIKASFSLFGDDEDGDLDKATIIAKKYISPDSVFSQSEGDWGDKLVIETTIPLGTQQSLENYLASNNRVAILLVEHIDEYGEIKVSVRATEFAAALDSELSDINFMLGFSLPADDTTFRVISDSRNEVTVGATAVFVSEKPYLYFSKTLKRRDEAEIVFKGGEGSVYSEIDPVIYFADQF